MLCYLQKYVHCFHYRYANINCLGVNKRLMVMINALILKLTVPNNSG